MQAQEGQANGDGGWWMVARIMGVDHNKAPGMATTANTNNKFKMAAKWLQSGKHRCRQRRAWKRENTKQLGQKWRERVPPPEKETQKDAAGAGKGEAAVTVAGVLWPWCSRNASRLASQSLKLKMKLKLKCQLEWNENDIKTEPTQSVTITITTMAVKGHQQQQQKARLSACIAIDSQG